MSLQIKKPSLKYIKNRSISLVIKRLNRKAPVILRRTLSDFHECPKVRLNVSSELFSGVNLFKQIEITETDKFENIEISVSDEVSSMESESSEEVNMQMHMVRFYSLPQLPSEKECVENRFGDDSKNKLQNRNLKKTKIDDFILLKAVSHGAYGKV